MQGTSENLGMNLPVEIHEKILNCLDGASLAKVTNVCRLWQDLALRLLHHRCIREIPEDIIAEIWGRELCLNSPFPKCPWDKIYLWWENSKPQNSPPSSVSEIVQQDAFTCYKLSGDCLIVSDQTGIIALYDYNGKRISIIANIETDVWEIAPLDAADKGPYNLTNNTEEHVLKTEHDYLVVVGRHYAHLYGLPIEGLMSQLVWTLNDLTSMSIAKASIFGSLFAIAEQPSILTIRQVELTNNSRRINVKEVTQITCHTWLWKWKIWRDRVICILATGQIAVWSLKSSSWISTSQRYPELLYQNPCFIFRGVIFCSSRTSQSLLEYWHCFPGDSYWLVCWDGENFNKYYPKLLIGDDVTAICIKRRLVVIGTMSGKLYLYEHRSQDVEIGNLWESCPKAVIQLADCPIRSCDVSVDGDALTVTIRTKKTLLLVARWSKKLSQSETEK